MENILKNLEPAKVFQYFEEITRIPHGSGNEKAISDYLVAFAKAHNLKFIQDSNLNVIIKKPATSGYESSPTVIIQGHMDMVCEKNSDTVHDFERDALKLRIVEDMIYATGTTLGADNGIAVAMGLAIFAADNIAHPALELLITTEEETGMGGAMGLDPKNIEGRLLINIDSEEEGKLLVSCAGGVRETISLPLEWSNPEENLIAFKLKLRGLKGGHSGAEIHLGRGNSNKLMGRVLKGLTINYSLVSINGGSKSNAIPREMDAVILIAPADADNLTAELKLWQETIKNEYKVADPNIVLSAELLQESFNKVFSKATAEKAIKLICLIPNGVQTMSMDIAGLVQSSTNLGVVTTTETEVLYQSAVRSSVRSLKEDILVTSKIAAEALGASFSTQSDYPDWQYNPNSKLRKIFKQVYKKLYGVEPEIMALHAGVECGLFKEKFEGIDMISFGPNLYDVHTPDEHMSISSVKNTWEYLIEVLKTLK